MYVCTQGVGENEERRGKHTYNKCISIWIVNRVKFVFVFISEMYTNV